MPSNCPVECKYFDDFYGCLCSSYDKDTECPLENNTYGRNKFDNEYAKWVLEEKRFEEE